VGPPARVFLLVKVPSRGTSPLTPSDSGKGDRKGDLLLDDDFLYGGDLGVGAEGAAEVFGFLPRLVLVVGLDQ
jgi:hypothetical protein